MKKSEVTSLLLIMLLLVPISACTPATSSELTIGKWRGEFLLPDNKIPFNFSVEDDTAALVKVYLTNGVERAPLDSIYYKKDSVVIAIDIYDAILIGKISNDSLHGYFRKNQSKSQGIPFHAAARQTFRFNSTGSFSNDSSSRVAAGKWSARLVSQNKEGKTDTTDVVLLLNETGSKLTGTILTTTGDYRYFEGVGIKNRIQLSAFSGSSPALLTGNIINGNEIEGELIGPRGKTRLLATRNDNAALADPYTLTYLKKGFDKLTFKFPDLSGKLVSLDDGKYKNKVVIVTIMGSWCPNCVDEASFLSPWYDQNKSKGVEIIGLTFERKDDINFARERVGKLIKRFDIKYDILFAGLADKEAASKKLPQINAVLSFPTTFLIDREGKVRKIHTGYTGPATGQYYNDFVSGFNQEVDALLKETTAASL